MLAMNNCPVCFTLLALLCCCMLFRASTSEDVTMATWGGSTAGNLESIDEDDDDDNDEDDDDDDEENNQDVAADSRNGELMRWRIGTLARRPDAFDTWSLRKTIRISDGLPVPLSGRLLSVLQFPILIQERRFQFFGHVSRTDVAHWAELTRLQRWAA